jgi:hypothetical protein
MKRRWSELSERDRGLVVVGTVIDTALKIAALNDLRTRPAEQIRGRRWIWATVLPLANSVGLVPLAYFLLGRRRGR